MIPLRILLIMLATPSNISELFLSVNFNLFHDFGEIVVEFSKIGIVLPAFDVFDDGCRILEMAQGHIEKFHVVGCQV